MAKKLHDNFQFSYDNFKVLLGGWNTWKQENAKDPNAYPIETTAGAAPSGGASDKQTAVTAPGIIVLTPAITSVTKSVPKPQATAKP